MKLLERIVQIALLLVLLPIMIIGGGSGGIHVQTFFILLVALGCLVHSISASKRIEPAFTGFSWVLGGTSFFLLVSILPLPIDWQAWISPGQVELTSKLFDSFAAEREWFTMSGAPRATWQALVWLLVSAGLFQLSWRWSHEAEFRRLLPLFLMLVGVLVSIVGMSRLLVGNTWWEGMVGLNHEGHFPPFNNRNHFALFTGMICLVSLGAGFRSLQLRFRWVVSKLAVVTGFFGISILCAAASLGAGSKGGLVSLVAGLTIVGFIWYWQSRSMDRLVLILCGFALLLVLMLNFGRETLLRFEDWLSYTGSETRDARLVLWADSWSMFKHYIATGIGVGAFEYVFPAYQSQFGHKTFTHAENDYLQLLTECGIFGAFFIGFFLFVLFSNFARLLKQPMSPMIMGGWGAVFCMLFHGIYDFPFHIGSLSFVFVLLLGYVLVSPSVLSIEDRQSIHSRTRVCFMAISAVLICFVSLRSAPAEFSSDKLKQDLTAASLNSGSPAQTLENWPFYWRARELLAYEGVMSSEGSLEVAQDMLLSAQALFPANPLISRHAALLFWRRNPEVALDFLEFACMTSNDPSSMLVEVLDKIVRYPSDVHWILPLTLSTRGFWRRGWDVIHSRGFREFDSIFSDEGTRRWLQDPVERASASETMIRYGHVQAVINAFQAAPPVEAGEHYWLAEAYRTAGSHGMAVKHFKLACEALALTETSLPSASSEEFLLDKAELSPDDTNLQLEAAATLYHRGELEASIPFWNRVAKARPYYKPAILALALSYQRSGMDKEAMEHWRHLIGGPGGMEARLRELRTLEQKGNETPKTLPKT